jgi:hypothetical protein
MTPPVGRRALRQLDGIIFKNDNAVKNYLE